MKSRSALDSVVITFRVTDPGSCRSVLSGGLLGTELHDAFLAGTIAPADHLTTDAKRLDTGSRSVFQVDGNVGRLTTSTIIEITFSATRNADNSADDCRTTMELRPLEMESNDKQ